MNTLKAQDRKREQRDTFLLLPILFFGILLMFLAGQLGIRLYRQWSLNANMGSVIDPDKNYRSGPGVQSLAPLDAGILTPFPWDKFQTPEAGSWNPNVVPMVIFPPVNTATVTPTPLNTFTPQPTSLPTKTFTPYPTNTWVVIFYPTWTPVPSRTPQPKPTHTATVMNTGTVTSTGTITRTPTVTGTATVTPTTTLTATTTLTITTTLTSTATGTQTETPTITATATETPTVTATATETQTPTVTPTETQTSTVTPTPTIIPPPGNVNVGPGDGAVTTFPDGSSIILDMGGTPISTNGINTPDMVYYELAAGPGILLDRIQIEISNDLVNWYTVFYWGDGVLDTNSSVGTGTYPATEPDNQPINAADLYGAPVHTGITINIDGLVPAGSYRYVRLTVPNSGGDGADVDAVSTYP